jgi:hypothetical protein
MFLRPALPAIAAIAALAACQQEAPPTPAATTPAVAASSAASSAAAASPACPASWLAAPAASGAIALPADGGHVVFHGAATGTQNYACKAADGGAPAWALVGPDATLADCNGAPAGRHFATATGSAEWQTSAESYVIGHKVAAAPQSGTIPSLLLGADSHGLGAPLAQVRYVHRVNTSGGAAPSTGCDAAHVGAVEKVPYTADYYFYAP